MNKKVLTLCAGFLLAGAVGTVNAEIAKVTDPEIGSSYVLGSDINEATGSMTYASATNSLAIKTGEFNQMGLEWTLEQALDADDKPIEGEFYLKAPNGYYVADAVSGDGNLRLVAETQQNLAQTFKLDDEGRIVFTDEDWYLATYNNTLCGQAFNNEAETAGVPSVKCVTYTATKELGGNDLISSISNSDGNYYFVAMPSADADNASAKVLYYDGTTAKLVDYADVTAGTYGDAYDAYLWKVSSVEANNIITYTFESRVDPEVKYSYTTTKAYDGGVYLTSNPSTADFDGKDVFAFYKSPVIYKTAAELNAILTNGFEMTIKKNADDKSVISGVDAFSGKLTAIPNNNNTRFQIINEDEEYLVLNTKANWGTGNVGVNDRGHKFEWVMQVLLMRRL